MPITFFPCRYVSPDSSMPCEQFFAEVPGENHLLCERHRTVMHPVGETQPQYIQAVNETAKLCHEMTLPELEAHIVSLEGEIAQLKQKYFSARSVRGEKLEKLSEEERAIRKAWKSSAPPESPKPKTTAKKDPQLHLQNTFGMDRTEAKEMLNTDIDDLLAKFAAAKAKKLADKQSEAGA